MGPGDSLGVVRAVRDHRSQSLAPGNQGPEIEVRKVGTVWVIEGRSLGDEVDWKGATPEIGWDGETVVSEHLVEVEQVIRYGIEKPESADGLGAEATARQRV